MDPFARGPSLNIANVALQSLREERPGALPAGARQYPGMRESAQGGAVRAAPQIVLDGSGNRDRIERVAKAIEELGQFFCGKQIEQHQDVGLLGELVAIGRVVLCLEDQIEAHDVWVFAPISVPVEFLQRLIALKLAENTVVMERQVKLAADVFPTCEFLLLDPQGLTQLAAALFRQQLKEVERARYAPGSHDI